MNKRVGAAGIVILGGLVGFVLVAHGYGPPRIHLPLYILCALVHLWAVADSRLVRNSRSALPSVIIIALLLRLVVCLTPESRGADYYRYLWDGALTANGISPYRYSPAEALRGETDHPEIARLTRDGREILAKINHPELRTIYPPVAQGLFALSYWIEPFNSTAWRAVLLLMDLTAGLLILILLRSARLPLTWATAYLWNPFLVIETYHFRHLDVALAPFLLVFIWGLSRRKAVVSAAGLAGAVAVKLWPALLFPLLVADFRQNRALALRKALVFACLAATLLTPYWVSLGSEANSGTVAYAKTWDANEFGFKILERAGGHLSRWSGSIIDGRIIARALVVLLLFGASAWFALLSHNKGLEATALAAGTLILLMLLIGPTVYPWYFVPGVAMAPFLRRPALIFWTPLLALTYLSRSVSYPSAFFAMVHLPAWAMLVMQIHDLHRRRTKRDD
ncbi:MAG TPA: glycosyltransferase 87 family protein [Acidobacteriota bacterium]|nr:glycosyltransferase 87 family protein [Acidobacteriota bacterium]